MLFVLPDIRSKQILTSISRRILIVYPSNLQTFEKHGVTNSCLNGTKSCSYIKLSNFVCKIQRRFLNCLHFSKGVISNLVKSAVCGIENI